jgi:hypothetical protein
MIMYDEYDTCAYSLVLFFSWYVFVLHLISACHSSERFAEISVCPFDVLQMNVFEDSVLVLMIDFYFVWVFVYNH